MAPSISQNLSAFLDMLGVSEGTSTSSATEDDGYDILVGGTRFIGYSDHPRILVDLGNGLKSTAAGKFQILERYFDVYKKQLNLPDFGYDSQDAIALQMIDECGALDDIDAGNLERAITKCSSRWASLPGNDYGQHTQKLAELVDAFTRAGGEINTFIP